MSIKTSKRIALGVITALVFAPFAAIAPASAAIGTAANVFISNATTVAVAGGNATAASALPAAAAPGASKTDGVIATSISALNVPASTAIVFTLKSATNGDTIGTSDLFVFSVAGQPISTTSVAAEANTHTIAFTAPSVAGSYAVKITYFRTATTIAAATLVAENNLTLTVGSAASGLAQFANSATTTASTAGDLVGLLIPTVSARIVEASGRVGQMVGFSPNYLVKRNAGHAGASANLNTAAANLNYTVTNPAGTAVSVVTAKVAGVASTQQDIAGPNATITTTANTSTTRSTPVDGSTVFFNPATAGVYTITVWHDANLDNLVSVGETSASVTVTVAADGLPSITFTKYGSNPTPAQSAAAFAGAHGQLVKVSLRNGTVPFTLAANESLVLTGPTLTVFDNVSTFNNTGGTLGNGNGTGGVTQSLTAANFNGAGDAWVSVGNTTAAGGTFAITAGIQGGTASGASGSFALTVVDTASAAADGGKTLVGNATSGFTNVNTGKGVLGPTIANGDAAATYDVKTGTATTVSLSTIVGATNGALFTAVVTDTLGLITGIAGSQFNVNATTAATGTTAATAITLSAAIPATTAGLANNTTVATMVIDKATDATVTIRSANSAISTVVVEPGSLTSAAFSIRAGVASANTFSALVLDQFGNAMATQAVTARVTAGRNLQALATPLVTGVDGRVSFTVTDTHTGTLLLTDTLTFTSGSAPDGVVTINYANYLPSATVTVTGAASEDVAPAISYNDINAGVAGASGTLVTITATLKDANGATLPAGIPVTWAISGLDGKSAIYVNPITGFNWSTTLTSATGAATTRVYAWAVGTVTVTATNNAIVGTGKINFRTVADSARVLSGSVSGNLFTAKVVDRYGNLVEGVNVTATRTTGPAVLQGTFPTSASQATIADGTVTFATTGGAGTFKLEISGGQSTSAAGKVGATTITVGSIGESLAPAGVPEVSVTIAAPVVPPVVVPPVVYDNPTLSFVKDGGRIILSGTAVDGEGDIIIYTKKVGTTAWKERAKTLEVAAPGDFNGSIKVPKSNVLIRVKQEGTGQFSNQVIVLK